MDLAGNVPIPSGVNQSIRSSTLTVYHDIDTPTNHSINNIKSNSYDPIVEFTSTLNPSITNTPNNGTNSNCITNRNCPTTKDTSIDFNYQSETKADNLFQLIKPNNTLQNLSTQSTDPNWKTVCDTIPTNTQTNTTPCKQLDPKTLVTKAGTNSPTSNTTANTPNTGNVTLTLGDNNPTQRDEDNQSCTTYINPTTNQPTASTTPGARKIGTCNDGIYTIKQNQTDTVGNYVNQDSTSTTTNNITTTTPGWKSYKVERDTVRPDAPTITVGKNGSINNERMSITVKGEAYSQAVITTTRLSPEESEKSNEWRYDLDSNGNFSSSNVAGQLECGVTYKVKVRIEDRAKNKSNEVEQTLTTRECGECPVYQIVEIANTDGINPDTTIKLRGGDLLYPFEGTYPPTSSFGWRTVPDINGVPVQNYHTGQDFGMNIGTQIRASQAGTIYNLYDANGYGNYVKIVGDKYTTIYGHLSSNNLIATGQTVTPGQVIGLSGNSGWSTAPHLHFEVRVGNTAVNPIPLLQGGDRTVVVKNTKYALVQITASNMTEDEAVAAGCPGKPDLPGDEDPGSPNQPNGSTGPNISYYEDYVDIDTLDFSMSEISEDLISPEDIVGLFISTLKSDFGYVTKFGSCEWTNPVCWMDELKVLIGRFTLWLQQLVNGIAQGIGNAAIGFVNDLMARLQQLWTLVTDPWSAFNQIKTTVSQLFTFFNELIGDPLKIYRLFAEQVMDFLSNGNIFSRAFSLGKLIGGFIVDKLLGFLAGFVSGGAGIALVMSRIISQVITTAGTLAKRVLKLFKWIGKQISIGINKIKVTIKKIGDKVGFGGSDAKKLVDELDDGDFDKIKNSVVDTVANEKLTDERFVGKMCGLLKIVSSAKVEVPVEQNKFAILFGSVSANAASGAPTCSLEGINNSSVFDDFPRNQHAWKHKGNITRFNGVNMSKETMRSWVEFMDDVITNKSKSITKVEVKGGSNIKFIRYYKQVDGQHIGVDVFTEGADAGKLRTVIELTQDQLAEF